MANGTSILDEEPAPGRGRYRNRFLESALNKPVVVVEKNNCVVRGTLTEYGRYRVALTDARIEHKRGVDVPWVIIERSHVAHIHPDVKAEAELKVGSVVYHIDRTDRHMTVREIKTATDEVVCDWFEGGENKQNIFARGSLRLVPGKP